jgi:YegS/Rv2252/BmrU family lipid kinase
MQATLIVNPAAGRGKGKKAYPAIAGDLDKLPLEFHTVFSEGPGHIVELAREACRDGSDTVVACGGDGTVHEVINGLDRHPARLGIIPCGTGDDLAINMGIPTDLTMACRNLISGKEKSFDLARAGNEVYACIAGTGFDSMVNRVANEGVRFLRGTSVYIYSVLKTLASFKPLEMIIRADDFLFEGRVMFVVAANASSYGGGMKIAPMARMDDGLLDLVIVEEMPRTEMLRSFPRVFSGKHFPHPRIKHLTTTKVELHSNQPLELFADGEFIQPLPVSLEVLPGALPVIIPRD